MTLHNNLSFKHIKLSIPDQLKTDNFRFIKLRGKTKVPQEPDFTKAANFAYDDPALLRHLEKGYNYGILGGQGGFIEIDADHEPLITELKNKLPKTFTVKTPHSGRIHKYIKTDDPHTGALLDTIEDVTGDRANMGHVTGYGRQVVGPGCSIFDCPECGATGTDDIRGTGANIECLKCGYKGRGEEKFYTIEDDAPIAETPWNELNKILGAFLVTKKQERGNDKEEDITEYTFANEKYQNIMDVLANPEDFEEDGDGRYRGFPIFSNHQKTGYFLVYAKTNTWYSWKDNEMGGIPQLIALQEKIIKPKETLKGEKWWDAIKIMEEKYGITIQREDQQQEKKKTRKEKYKEQQENDTAEIMEVLKDNYTFITTKDTKTIYYYNEGIYEEADRLIEMEVERYFKFANSTYFTNEIINHLRRETYIARDDFNTDKKRIPLKNGLFNIETFELEEFDENKIFTYRFSVAYDADAVCPNIEEWITQIVSEDSFDLFQEYCGYGFEPSFPLHIALWMHGSGRNGKGAFIRLYKKLIGDNGSSVPLEQMNAKYRFALIGLLNSFVNVCSEPQSNYVFQTETFKKATGGDEIEGEIKGLQKKIKFTSFAKFFIMGNKYPTIEDDTIGFWDRMVIVKFPHDYSKDFIVNIEDKKIEKDGGEDKALAGFFNWCMVGLKRLKNHGYKISESKSSEETRLEFEKVSNSIRAFITECVVLKPSEKYPQPDLWNEYKNYCDRFGLEIHQKSVFTTRIGEQRGVTLKPAKVGGKTQRFWFGLAVKEYDEEESTEENEKNKDEENTDGLTKLTKLTDLHTTRGENKNIKGNEIGEYIQKLSTLTTSATPEEKPTPIEIKKFRIVASKCKECGKEDIDLAFAVHYSNDTFKNVCEPCGKRILNDYDLNLIRGGEQ